MDMTIKDIFINRKQELSELVNGLKLGSDFVLVAPRRFGKTALSIKVLEEIGLDKNYIIVDIDLMKYSGGSIKNLAESIIEKILNALGIKGKLRRIWRELDFAFSVKVKYQDLEIEPLLQLVRHDDSDEWAILEEALNLAQKIAEQTKKHLVVFYDEFGELYSMGERVINLFRSVLQRHTKVSYLFAGSQETIMNKIFLDKSGAFYRFGELIYLKELERKDVYEYILSAYPQTDQKPQLKDATLLEAILDELKGHPYYTAQVIAHLERHKNATLENYYQFLYHDLFEREEAYFALQVSKIKQKHHALDIIRSIALGFNPYTESNLREQNVYTILTYLQESGFIRKESRGCYVITDPLLERFLIDG
jgi:AAA+ ATPase superfamily predicted ATPase